MEKKLARHELRMDATSYALLQAEAKREHRSVNILEAHIGRESLRQRAVRMEKAGLDSREATKQALGA
jgi:hypothetical protein